MTPKWGHADLNDRPNGAAGGTLLAALPSPRRRCGRSRATLWLCSQAGVLPGCRHTRDAASSSALLFCCCMGAAGRLLCGPRYLHFSQVSVSTLGQVEASPQSAPLRSLCWLGSAKRRGKRSAIAALLLHQPVRPAVRPAFPWEPASTINTQSAGNGIDSAGVLHLGNSASEKPVKQQIFGEKYSQVGAGLVCGCTNLSEISPKRRVMQECGQRSRYATCCPLPGSPCPRRGGEGQQAPSSRNFCLLRVKLIDKT